MYSLMEKHILWLGHVIINSFLNKSLKKNMVFYTEDESKNEGVLLPGLQDSIQNFRKNCL
jgi:hypothetical protein